MRFIELFAGIGGFRYGLESVGRTEQEIPKGQSDNGGIMWGRDEKKKQGIFTCVYANEWDKYACQIYRKNFGLEKGREHISKRGRDGEYLQPKGNKSSDNRVSQGGYNQDISGKWDEKSRLYEGDITKIPTESIPDHDLLTAGFPCPSFSIAGKRKGFKDPRGALFFEICRIAKVKKPHLLLLENVKGLLNHKKGITFRIILNSLSELGYDCEWEVPNSKNFGVPQNRERVFIVGHLRGKSGQKVFPIGSTMRKGDEGSKRQTSGCVKGVSGHIQNDDTYLIYWKNSKEKWVKENRKYTTVIKAQSDLCRRPLVEHQQDFVHNQNGILRTLPGGTHGNTQHFTKTIINNSIRRLTPTECERLQGFPDGWTKGISDSQRYKCLGNAVTVNVIEEIGRKILKVVK